MNEQLTVIVLITLAAAMVNGALGHGFSSITVPVALLFYTNRLLNPALVLLEVGINSYVVVMNRSSLPRVWRRLVPIVLALIPGVVVGSFLLSRVNAEWLKLFVYGVLLPLILLQAAGVRRPITLTPAVALPFGAGLGVLYSLTTVSGPPLALFFNNQGLVKQEFRAALGIIRIAESVATAIAYYHLGLYTAPSLGLLAWIAPSVVIGVPLGAVLIQRIDLETFRRLCMSFDAWIVGFGLSKVLLAVGLVPGPWAYLVLLIAVLVDTALLVAFFRNRQLAPTLTVVSDGNWDPARKV
jgi:uncharacterized membrane protein YfcA